VPRARSGGRDAPAARSGETPVKIAAFPKCYLDEISVARTMTVFDWIQDARSLGADGLELYEGFLESFDDGYVAAIGDALTAAEFEMPMLCCSPDFTHPDRDARERAVEHEAALMRVTRLLGGPGASCRVLTGQRHPGVALEQGLEWAVTAISSLIPLARELDVVLVIENHYKDGRWNYPEFAQRKDVFLQVLAAIDETEHFGVQYDPSNAIVAGDDPVEFLREVLDRVVTMQASDRYLEPGTTLESLRQASGTLGYATGLRHGVVGEGLNDYDTIFAMLSRAGYDGWVSVEDGLNGLDEIRQSIDFLKVMRQKYFSAPAPTSAPGR
jgi:sugar phosphate isomerase/epimerase